MSRVLAAAKFYSSGWWFFDRDEFILNSDEFYIERLFQRLYNFVLLLLRYHQMLLLIDNRIISVTFFNEMTTGTTSSSTRWDPPFYSRHLQMHFLVWTIVFVLKLHFNLSHRSPIKNNSYLLRIMAWPREADKPMSEPMTAQFTGAKMRHSASISVLRHDKNINVVS